MIAGKDSATKFSSGLVNIFSMEEHLQNKIETDIRVSPRIISLPQLIKNSNVVLVPLKN